MEPIQLGALTVYPFGIFFAVLLVPFFMLTVGAGEVISCGLLGTILLKLLKKNRRQIFQ